MLAGDSEVETVVVALQILSVKSRKTPASLQEAVWLLHKSQLYVIALCIEGMTNQLQGARSQ